jgi:hypothetical protein
VGIGGIWRYLGLLSTSIEPAMDTLGGLDAFQWNQGEKASLQTPPVYAVPYFI